MSSEKFMQIQQRIEEAFNLKELKKRLSVSDYENFLNSRKFVVVNKGEVIFRDGEMPKGIYLIEKGTAKLCKSGYYGKEQILRFIKKGDILGYRSILCGESFQAKAEAMTTMEMFFIPTEMFLYLLEIDSKISYTILQKIAYELGESSNIITFLAQKSVRERLAEILLILEGKLGVDEQGFIKLSLTREEIANLIGTATESAIRLISEFKNDDLIKVEGRSIKIINREKLRKLGHCMD